MMHFFSSVCTAQQGYPVNTFGYQYERNLSIEGDSVSGNLINFPVLVKINDTDMRSVSNGGNVAFDDGRDIIFVSNNYSLLNFDIDEFDEVNGILFAWVNIPSLAADTNYSFKMLYGNAEVAAGYAGSNAWDNNYKAVWHMNDVPATATDSLMDATIHNNNGGFQNMDSINSITGQIGSALAFNANDTNYVIVPHDTSQAMDDEDQVTVEAWIKKSSFQNDPETRRAILNKSDESYNLQIYNVGGDDNYRFSIHDGSGYESLNSTTDVIYDWVYLVGTADGSTNKIFVNGQEEASNDPNAIKPTVSDIWIGNNSENPSRVLDAELDEIRLSNVARSADWISTSYSNMNDPDAFITVGIQNDNPHSGMLEVCQGDTVTYSVFQHDNDLPFDFNYTNADSVAGTDTSITVVWTGGNGTIEVIIDNATGSITESFSVTVNPLPAPLIIGLDTICPDNKTNIRYEIDSSNSNHSYSWDILGGTITQADKDSAIVDWSSGSDTLLWVTETIDATGCSASDTLDVFVGDVVAPYLATITLDTVYLDTDGMATIDSAFVVDSLSDNCTVDSVHITQTLFECAHAGQLINDTIIAYDVNGNSDTAYFQIRVLDTISPYMETITLDTVYLDTDGMATIDSAFVVDSLSDNCTVDSVHITQTLFECAQAGQLINDTIIAYDVNGNSDTAYFQIRVLDTISPYMETNPTLNLILDETTGLAIIDIDSIDDGSFDNCGFNLEISRDTFNCHDVGVSELYVVLTATDDAGNIARDSTLVAVDYETLPSITYTPANDSICSGETVEIDIESNLDSTSYNWIINTHADITGESDGSNDEDDFQLSQTLTNNGDTARLVEIIMQPSLYGECNLLYDTLKIWVEPTPVITADPVSDTICDEGILQIDISSNQLTTRKVMYTYTSAPDNPGSVTGNTSHSTGVELNTLIIDTLDNNTGNAQRIVYTITPHTLNASGELDCAGTPITVDVWVEPTPVITSDYSSDTICNAEIAVIDISSTRVATKNILYTYSATPDNPATITGYTSNTTGKSIYEDVEDTLINNTDTAQRIEYTFTPYVENANGTISCPGTPIQVEIWVEPTPWVSSSPAIDTICNGNATNISLSSPTIPTHPVQFRYTTEPVYPDSVDITYNADTTGLIVTDIIADNITNNANTAQLVRYIITPYTVDNNGEERCEGIADTSEIWIEPSVTITAIPLIDTICDGEQIDIDINSIQVPTNQVLYTYTSVADNPGFVSGNTSDNSGLTLDDNITDILINTSDTAQRVVYTINSYTEDSDGGMGCPQSSVQVEIRVEPTASVSSLPIADTICDGGITSISLHSPTGPTRPVQFRYTVAPENPLDIQITYNGDTTDLGEQDIISDNIDNLSDTAQLVRFIITPYTTNNTGNEKCAGISDTTIVWVEPTPLVTSLPPIDTICDGELTHITLNSPTEPTRPVRFRYTAVPDNPADIDITYNGDTTDLIETDIIANSIDNLSNNAQRIKYIITPYTIDSNGNEKCAGISDTTIIWVEPSPSLTAMPVSDTICDEGQININLNSAQSPTRQLLYTYISTPDNPGSVNGNTSDGTGLPLSQLIQDNLDNLSDSAQRVVYTITPHLQNADGGISCAGVPIQVEIWVEPTATVNPAPILDTICDNGLTNITLVSPSVPTRPVQFRYTVIPVNPANVDITLNGDTTALLNNDIIGDNIDNQTNIAQEVRIVITPYTVDNNGDEKCSGRSDTAIVWVEPTPLVSSFPPVDTICDAEATHISIGSPTIPTLPVRFRYTVVPANPADVDITFESDSTDLTVSDLIEDIIDNLSDDAQEIRIIITPYTVDGGGNERCAGIADTSIIWVEPTPVILSTPMADTICDTDQINLVISSDQNPTRQVLYTYYSTPDNPGLVSGNTYNNNGLPLSSILQDMLDNSSNQAQRVVYTLTPHLETAGGQISCAASPVDIDIWVEPTPVVTVKASDGPPSKKDTICTNLLTDINLNSPTQPTRPVRFSYQVNHNPSVTVYHGGTTTGLPNLTNLYDSIVNTSNVPQLVQFVVTPYARDAVGETVHCSGINDTAKIWVAPAMQVDKDTSNYNGVGITCHGEEDGWIRLNTYGGIEAFSNYDSSHIFADWSTLPDQKYQSNLGGGFYSYTASDALGCLYSDTIEIIEPPVLQSNIDEVQGVNCSQVFDGVLEIIGSGGTGAYDPFWIDYPNNPGLDTDAFINDSLRNGFYRIRLTDVNGCTSEDYHFLEGNKIFSVFPGSSPVSCKDGSDGEITVEFNEPLVFNWYGPDNYTDTCEFDQNNDDPCYIWPHTLDDFEGGFGTLTYMEDNLEAGDYTLIVKDTFNCRSQFEIEITEPDSLKIRESDTPVYANGYNVQCFDFNNGRILLDSIVGGNNPGNYFYNWSTSNGGGLVADSGNQYNLKAGDYEVSVSDNKGCTDVATFSLNQPDEILYDLQPSVYNGYNITCNAENTGTITALTDSLVAYGYQWSNGENTQTIENLTKGHYTVTITQLATNCEITDSVELTEPAPIFINDPIYSNYNGVQLRCFGDNSGEIAANVTGGAPGYDYHWENEQSIINENGPSLDSLSSGQYYLTVTDLNGCEKDTTLALNQEPEAISFELNKNDLSCAGKVSTSAWIDSLSGGMGNYDYLWSNGDDQDSITINTGGMYSVTITDMNDCKLSKEVEIKVLKEILIEFNVLTHHNGYAVACKGDSTATLTADISNAASPYLLEWQGIESSDDTLKNLPAGNYTLQVTDQNGCINDNTIELEEPEKVNIITDNNITPVTCYGYSDGSIFLEGSGGVPEYQFYFNDTPVNEKVLDGLEEGTYSVGIKDQNNCYCNHEITIESPDTFVISTTEIKPTCPESADGEIHAEVTGRDDYTLLWRQLNEGGNVISELTRFNNALTIDNLDQGYYVAEAMDENQCMATDSIFLEGLVAACLDIPNAFIPDGRGENEEWLILSYEVEDALQGTRNEKDIWLVYPKATIEVFNRWGNLVYRANRNNPEPWNGGYQNDKNNLVPMDSYHYIIRLNDGSGQTEQGVVTVIY
jgi:hypothetical protein